jgi:hypothetical protein
MKMQLYQVTLEYRKGSYKREVYNYESLYLKKSERFQINNLIMSHKILGKKAKISQIQNE